MLADCLGGMKDENNVDGEGSDLISRQTKLVADHRFRS